MEVFDFKGPGVTMGMHNTRASFNYGIARGYPVYQEYHPQGL